MPVVLLIVLLAILIAAFGFWDTLTAIVGGTVLLVLFLGIVVGFLGLFGFWVFGQFRR
ncbi:hypothetical protein [Arenibaculum sp.]|jgi:uncharacterized membrane protein|uniref:hypothetical protein n=1 Tax=Arenibaculum sp. TaxID=2865862 RepID=UPI002E158B03|nr:hypothetical protein [Arenibaculum sp.]